MHLPYARGNAIAIALDREIARVSGGNRSLDLMRELVVEARAGAHVNVESLLARFARETSPPFVAKLRAAIVYGAPVPLDPDVLAPCLRVAHEHDLEMGKPMRAVELVGGGNPLRYLPQGAMADVRVFALADAAARAKML